MDYYFSAQGHKPAQHEMTEPELRSYRSSCNLQHCLTWNSHNALSTSPTKIRNSIFFCKVLYLSTATGVTLISEYNLSVLFDQWGLRICKNLPITGQYTSSRTADVIIIILLFHFSPDLEYPGVERYHVWHQPIPLISCGNKTLFSHLIHIKMHISSYLFLELVLHTNTVKVL